MKWTEHHDDDYYGDYAVAHCRCGKLIHLSTADYVRCPICGLYYKLEVQAQVYVMGKSNGAVHDPPPRDPVYGSIYFVRTPETETPEEGASGANVARIFNIRIQ